MSTPNNQYSANFKKQRNRNKTRFHETETKRNSEFLRFYETEKKFS